MIGILALNYQIVIHKTLTTALRVSNKQKTQAVRSLSQPHQLFKVWSKFFPSTGFVL